MVGATSRGIDAAACCPRLAGEELVHRGGLGVVASEDEFGQGPGIHPAGESRPPLTARRLCLECRMRLPGYGRTGTPANDVEDYRLVVD